MPRLKFTSVRATVWQAKGATGTLNSLLLEGHVEVFCAIGVAVGEVQLSPVSLHAVHMDYVARPQAGTGLTRRLIEVQRFFAILPSIPPAFKRGRCLFEGGVYSRKYGTCTYVKFMQRGKEYLLSTLSHTLFPTPFIHTLTPPLSFTPSLLSILPPQHRWT